MVRSLVGKKDVPEQDHITSARRSACIQLQVCNQLNLRSTNYATVVEKKKGLVTFVVWSPENQTKIRKRLVLFLEVLFGV